MSLQQSSQQWWGRVKNDDAALLQWLEKQYHGEAMAAQRLGTFLERFGHQAPDPKWRQTVEQIIEQESEHARWVGQLLIDRGASASIIEGKQEPYWEETLDGIEDWETGCAVAAHAEGMRLARIEAIVNDPTAPDDIRAVFAKILPEERFHEKAFRHFASDEAYDKAQDAHERGAQALGLVF